MTTNPLPAWQRKQVVINALCHALRRRDFDSVEFYHRALGRLTAEQILTNRISGVGQEYLYDKNRPMGVALYAEDDPRETAAVVRPSKVAA